MVGHRNKLKTILLGMFLFAASANAEEMIDFSHSMLNSLVTSNQTGMSRDVWIQKFQLDGTWGSTSLVFGYADDLEFCQEVIEMYMVKYYLDQYRCVYAN